jgi:LAO/AO transport system kinase
LELADALIINKADGDAERQAAQSLAQYQGVIDLVSHNPNWKTRVMSCSGLKNKNIDIIYLMINEFVKIYSQNDLLMNKRLSQNRDWFIKIIDELFNMHLCSDSSLAKLKSDLERDVTLGKTLPLTAAQEYVHKVFTK